MRVIKQFLIDQAKTFRDLAIGVIDILEIKLSNRSACHLQNITQWARRRPTRYFWSKEKNLFFATNAGLSHYFSERIRGFRFYSRGINIRALELASTYFIDQIDFEKDDVVIDCGANFADLYRHLEGKISADCYIAIEPGSGEYRSIQENAPSGRVFKCGLGNKDEIRTFYLQSSSGDSSFIEPVEYESKYEIEVKRLDTLLHELKLDRVKLFKLEAEGFEPEILQGSEEFLKKCHFVAIDGGNERGVKQEETFSFQVNFLLNRGYELLATNFNGGRALLRNLNQGK